MAPTTTGKNPKALAFGRTLRTELDRTGLSARKLGRLFAAKTGTSPEVGRRNIQRWLAGDNLPSEESRGVLADVLGSHGGALPPSDEDEEEDMLTVLYTRASAAFAELEVELERRREEVTA
jgi:hypothetical protein